MEHLNQITRTAGHKVCSSARAVPGSICVSVKVCVSRGLQTSCRSNWVWSQVTWLTLKEHTRVAGGLKTDAHSFTEPWRTTRLLMGLHFVPEPERRHRPVRRLAFMWSRWAHDVKEWVEQTTLLVCVEGVAERISQMNKFLPYCGMITFVTVMFYSFVTIL